MSEKLKRKSDWEGRYVMLKFDTATNGGAVFKSGDVMLVERNFGGLHLKATRNCKECGQQHRLFIIKVSERDVELLPNGYVPSEHVSRSDFLQAELAAARSEIARLREALIELIHRVNAWGSKTAGQSLPTELSDAIFRADLAVTQKQEGGAK